MCGNNYSSNDRLLLAAKRIVVASNVTMIKINLVVVIKFDKT